MKKTIVSIAIIAAAFLAASCQKENLQENIAPEGSASVFTATIESGASTKTTVERVTSPSVAYKTKWESGDQISINGVTYSATPDGTDATKATFTKVGEASNPTPTYKAYFPASLYNGTTATLPANYTYADGKYNMPMYAESETTTLSFKNICAVLAIKVTSADITALKSIKVKSDKKLNGTFTVASTTDGYKAVIGTDGSNEVVLSMGETPIDPTTDGITFYIAIPAQEYSYLKIYISEDGTLYKRAMITKKAAGLGTIDCNKIYNIAYKTNAVQMYADGPYWSTMNLGASTETGYGDYYVWGATAKAYSAVDYTITTGAFTFVIDNPYGDIYENTWNKLDGFSWNNTPWTKGVYNATSNKNVFTKYIPSSKSDYWKGTDSPDDKITLDLADDAAHVKWGDTWRMPTSAEFKALKEATYWNWEDGGYYVYAPQSGDAGKKNGETTNTYNKSDALLFFPAAGYGYGTGLLSAGSYGDYWSSTLDSSYPDYAYDLYFSSGDVNPQNGSRRYYGFSVRPVSD